MRIAVLTSPGHFRLESASRPEPAPDQAVVRIQAVGICGSDLHLFREGSVSGVRIEDAGGPFPPGHECMGVVEEVGKDVSRALIGRRVFIEPAIPCGRCHWCLAGKPNVCPHTGFIGVPPIRGCLQQWLAHPAHLCEPLPDEIDDDTAVLLEPLAVAVHSMDRVAPLPGTGAVVLGAGTVGLTHVLLLARTGISPLIVTDPLDFRLELARKLGATHTINPRQQDVVKAVAEITHGAGAESVFECAGVPQTFDQMGRVAVPAGRVGVVGIPSEDYTPFPTAPSRRKGLDILLIRRANRTFHRAVARVVHEKLPLRTLATHHWPLERVEEAFRTASDYADGIVKGIINP